MELSNFKEMDPNILYSIINMKLRDFYSSLNSLCDDLNIVQEELIIKLKMAGYEYNNENNRFE